MLINSDGIRLLKHLFVGGVSSALSPCRDQVQQVDWRVEGAWQTPRALAYTGEGALATSTCGTEKHVLGTARLAAISSILADISSLFLYTEYPLIFRMNECLVKLASFDPSVWLRSSR